MWPANSDNQQAFDYWWSLPGAWVETPNERRNGSSGVKRATLPDQGCVFVKVQKNHQHRSLRHPLGRPTIMREAEAIAVCRQLGITTPEVLWCGKRKTPQGWQAVLATRELSGFCSLEDWLATPHEEAVRPGVRALVIQSLAATLKRFHQARWQHGCLYPKHIFLRIQGQHDALQVETALIDLEKCRRRLSAAKAGQRDLQQLKRHLPEFTDSDWRLLYSHYYATAPVIHEPQAPFTTLKRRHSEHRHA